MAAQMADARGMGRDQAHCSGGLSVGNAADVFSPFTAVQRYLYQLHDSGMLDIINEILIISARLCGESSGGAGPPE